MRPLGSRERSMGGGKRRRRKRRRRKEEGKGAKGEALLAPPPPPSSQEISDPLHLLFPPSLLYATNEQGRPSVRPSVRAGTTTIPPSPSPFSSFPLLASSCPTFPSSPLLCHGGRERGGCCAGGGRQQSTDRRRALRRKESQVCEKVSARPLSRSCTAGQSV